MVTDSNNYKEFQKLSYKLLILFKTSILDFFLMFNIFLILILKPNSIFYRKFYNKFIE